MLSSGWGVFPVEARVINLAMEQKMKEKVKVSTICDKELWVWDIPSNLKDFMDYWQDLFNEVPEQYREFAKIELDTKDSYGSATIECTIYYEREETDEEEMKREFRIKHDEARRNEWKMQEYFRLQKELGL